MRRSASSRSPPAQRRRVRDARRSTPSSPSRSGSTLDLERALERLPACGRARAAARAAPRRSRRRPRSRTRPGLRAELALGRLVPGQVQRPPTCELVDRARRPRRAPAAATTWRKRTRTSTRASARLDEHLRPHRRAVVRMRGAVARRVDAAERPALPVLRAPSGGTARARSPRRAPRPRCRAHRVGHPRSVEQLLERRLPRRQRARAPCRRRAGRRPRVCTRSHALFGKCAVDRLAPDRTGSRNAPRSPTGSAPSAGAPSAPA